MLSASNELWATPPGAHTRVQPMLSADARFHAAESGANDTSTTLNRLRV